MNQDGKKDLITIDYLADHLDTIPTLTKWFRAQWPDCFADWSQAEMEQDFLSDASRNIFPSRLVAFEAGELAGTIVLHKNGTELLSEFQPELGGLYVVKSHRGHGVGTELVRSGKNLALDQGYATVYATTVKAAGILEHLDCEFIKMVVHYDREVALYQCKL